MNSLFKRHFALTAGMILFSFALLAASFMALSYQYTVRNQKEALQQKSSYAALLTARLLCSGMAADSEDFTASLSSTARMMGTDVLFTDADGVVLAVSDDSEQARTWVGKTLPQWVTASLDQPGSDVTKDSLSIFPDSRFCAAAKVEDTGRTGETLGYVIVSVPQNTMTEIWRPLTRLFILTALAVLCIAFLSSSFTARQQVKPLQEMTDVVHRFGMGEYDLRVGQDICKRQDEMGELGTAFNAMADSIALAERKRSEFVANVSHELKTPMTTIAGFADGILDGTIPPEREREYLKTISDETRRLSRLVRRMLDLSRLQKRDVVISQTEFDMVEVIAQTLISLEGRINGKGLDVDARLPDNPVFVWGDPDAITQVCYNLLENAIKFSYPRTEIGISLTTRGNKAYISVRDTGETIPEEELPLIFDRLHKSDRSRSLDKEGVGLGLYLVKTILGELKETITVTSQDHVTEFTFTLTLAR